MTREQFWLQERAEVERKCAARWAKLALMRFDEQFLNDASAKFEPMPDAEVLNRAAVFDPTQQETKREKIMRLAMEMIEYQARTSMSSFHAISASSFHALELIQRTAEQALREVER